MFLRKQVTVLEGEHRKSNLVNKIAVIVATHNRPKMLERALLSILSQDIDDVSIVIVDNGNLIETKIVAQTYRRLHPQIRYIKNSFRKGSAVTRNYGLFSLSKEIKYVFFLDDDDLLSEKSSLRTLLRKSLSDSRKMMTYGIQRDVRTDGSIYQIWPCRKTFPRNMIIDDCKVQFPAHTVLWNAEFARFLGGYSMLFENDMEDIAFIFKGYHHLMASPINISYVDMPIVDWRRGDISENTLHSLVRRNPNHRMKTRLRLRNYILRISGYEH